MGDGTGRADVENGERGRERVEGGPGDEKIFVKIVYRTEVRRYSILRGACALAGDRYARKLR